MGKHIKRRVPKLSYTDNQCIGWHVNHRDRLTGMPRQFRVGMVSNEEAKDSYTKTRAECSDNNEISASAVR